MSEIEKIKAGLRKKAEPREVNFKALTKDMYLSSGSTLLNLACTDRAVGAFVKGTYSLFVGDSDSGKTFFVLSILAEAAKNPNFDNYRFIFDCPEQGALMDIEKFFGSKAAKRIEPPRKDKKGDPIYSQTVEDFYYHVDDALEEEVPFIYILDSQDSLSSKAEGDAFQKNKKFSRRSRGDSDAKIAGSYGDSKAKLHSANLRRIIGLLKQTGSILIIVNQTRDAFNSLFEKSTYSGGKALKFYSCYQVWSSQKGKIKKRVKGKDRQLGIKCKLQVKKNRVTGKDRIVYTNIFHSVGIDDLGSMISYLVEEGVWKCSENVITATGIGPEFSAKLESLIKKIYDDDLEEDVRDLVVNTWNEIESGCTVERKKRYE